MNQQGKEPEMASKTTVNGYASRAEHIKALMASGMTERAARIAEMKAFVGEMKRRAEASGRAAQTRAMHQAWLQRTGQATA